MAGEAPDLSGILGSLLSNPAALAGIAELLGSLRTARPSASPSEGDSLKGAAAPTSTEAAAAGAPASPGVSAASTTGASTTGASAASPIEALAAIASGASATSSAGTSAPPLTEALAAVSAGASAISSSGAPAAETSLPTLLPSAPHRERRVLLSALGPYLSPRRRRTLDGALRLLEIIELFRDGREGERHV